MTHQIPSWRPPGDAERAELEALFESISELGRTRRGLRLIVVSWAPDLLPEGYVGIVGPRAYRHPDLNPDPPDIAEWSSPPGIVRIEDEVPMRDGCAAYVLLVDRDDPEPRGPTWELSRRERDRPELDALRRMFERAGRLVGAWGVPSALRSHRDDLTWFGALVELVEPDVRITWGEPARQFFPPDHEDHGIEMVAPIGRNHDRAVPCCQVFEDTVHASQAAIRRLLAGPPGPVEEEQAEPIEAGSKEGRSPRVPSEEDWAIWQTHRTLGGTQTETAETLARMWKRRVEQYQVSRAVTRCRAHLDAGGTPPLLSSFARGKQRRGALPMDPSKLQRGSPRLSQRPRSDESE